MIRLLPAIVSLLWLPSAAQFFERSRPQRASRVRSDARRALARLRFVRIAVAFAFAFALAIAAPAPAFAGAGDIVLFFEGKAASGAAWLTEPRPEGYLAKT